MNATKEWHRRALIGAFTLALLAGGCQASEEESSAPTTSVETATKGGTLVLGANQEPACADWYAACGTSSWGFDMMGNQTLPRPFMMVDFEYRPSSLLAAEPTLEMGPPQRVTYRIEPQAVWSDGRPITSSDFAFTFEQTKASRLASTVVSIAGVDDSDPKVAVVTYRQPDPAWRDKFNVGILPRHLLEGKDRAAEMATGYKWSGGPWLIDHWTKGQEIKLVPNPTYWASKPHLDAVIFKVITDTAAYQAAYKTGQIDMIFLQGAQPEAAELKNLPDSRFVATLGLSFEVVNFNVSKPPFDSRAVRQALAYAADRDAIVTQLSGPFLPGVKPAQTFRSPVNKKWYSESFARYRRDLAKVNQLMTEDGWAKGPDGVWAKAGTKAAIEFSTTGGNRRRELTQEILASQWKQAGFDVTINNPVPTMLLGDWHPKGTFQASLSGLVPVTTEPNACSTFCSKNTPTEGNGFQGGNFRRIASPALDAAWDAVEREVDDVKRVELVRRAQDVTAEEVPGIPVSPQLDIVVYNPIKVGGPVLPDPGGIFSRLNEWYCRASSCRR